MSGIYNSSGMMYLYKLTNEEQIIDGRLVAVNGVRVESKSNPQDVCVINNISSDRHFVIQLIKLLSHFDVSPINAYEVVEDIIQQGELPAY